jgi:hypothetical protein
MRVGRLVLAGLTLCVAAGSAAAAGVALKSTGPAEPTPSANRAIDPAAPGSDLLHNFYFVRAQYTDGGAYPNWKDWKTDFPKADVQFLTVFTRLADVDAFEQGLPIRLDDPELRRFPYLYAVEVGQMKLTDTEVEGLRDYLLAGGFLVVDDFWGTDEWRSFETQMRRVLPERRLVDVPMDHALFHSYYDIDEIVQVPNSGQAASGGRTWESDGVVPAVRGIFAEDGRLMVVANWNTDLGDAWEYAESPYYPLQYSTYAIRMGVNMIVYALSH